MSGETVATQSSAPEAAAAPTDRRQERRRAKQDRIVSEAWVLAHRDGLAAISLRDLADAVGLRQPSLYVYFPAKVDLIDAMFADGYRQMLDFIGRQDYYTEPREALSRFVADCVWFSSENVVRHQLLFQRTIPGFEPSAASYELALGFYEIARRLAEAAGLRTQAELDLLSALVNGLAHQQVANDPGGRRWVDLADQAVSMFFADVDHRRRPSSSKADR